MRYKIQPEDFVVEKRIRLPLAPEGPFAIYRVHKRGVTTLSVQAQMARALAVPESAVVFPALKDKEAIAMQYVAVRGAGSARSRAPAGSREVTGDGFAAEFVGYGQRPLAPADVVANRFTIVLRELLASEATSIGERLAQVAQCGLPNYFDQQRFGSMATSEEHIGRRILRRDVEGALRAYLTQPFVGDPAPVREFKAGEGLALNDLKARVLKKAYLPKGKRALLVFPQDVSACPAA